RHDVCNCCPTKWNLGRMLTQMRADHTEIMTVSHPCRCKGSVRVILDSSTCQKCGGAVDLDSMEPIPAEGVAVEIAYVRRRRPPAASDPLIGERLGHFRVMSRMGVGGMGAVYRALDESL